MCFHRNQRQSRTIKPKIESMKKKTCSIEYCGNEVEGGDKLCKKHLNQKVKKEHSQH